MVNGYESVLCPMPECEGELYLGWSMGRAVFDGDLTEGDGTIAPTEAHTQTWTIDCSQGHTVLLPDDTAEDWYEFDGFARRRLRELLDRLKERA